MIGVLGLNYIRQKSYVKSEDFTKDNLVQQIPSIQALLTGCRPWDTKR